MPPFKIPPELCNPCLLTACIQREQPRAAPVPWVCATAGAGRAWGRGTGDIPSWNAGVGAACSTLRGGKLVGNDRNSRNSHVWNVAMSEQLSKLSGNREELKMRHGWESRGRWEGGSARAVRGVLCPGRAVPGPD